MRYSEGDIVTIATRDELQRLGYSCSSDSAVAYYEGQRVRIVEARAINKSGVNYGHYKIELVDSEYKLTDRAPFIGSVSDYLWPEYTLVEILGKDIGEDEYERVLFEE